MIQDFSYLREIERSLCNPLGFISERTANTPSQVWRDLFSENRWESDFKAFLAGKLAEYRNALVTMQLFDLHAINRLRGQELLQHFQRMQGVCSKVSAPVLQADELRFIQAFQVLTLGYISATAWEYMKPAREMDANKFLAPFLSAGLTIEEVAKSVETQGLTDADTFLQLLSGPIGKHRKQAKPQPKDTILNNHTAVALLDKMKDAGKLGVSYQWRYTDNQGQPVSHTNYERATFANYITIKAEIAEWDKAFCDLWGLPHRTLSKALDALDKKTEKTKRKYSVMLSIFDNPT